MGNVFFAVRAVIKSHGDGRREERERERKRAPSRITVAER
jgi:hypothetical protein